MKKLLCALLALAMLCACAMAETVDVTGTWYLNEIKLGEERINPAAMNLELAFTLNENGAFVDGYDWAVIQSMAGMEEANHGEEPLEGAWEMRGDSVIVTIEDSAMAFATVDGGLVFDSSALDDVSYPEINIRLTFRRERPEADVFDPGTALTDVTMADFDGTWNATLVQLGGIKLTPAEIGMEITIELSGGEGRFLQKYAASAETIEFSVVGELTADGALILSDADGNAQSALYRLYDSGVMACLEEGEGGLSGAIYFVRAEAGAEE